MIRDILTVMLLVTSAGLMLTAAIGILRLPDLLCRSHAVAKASSLGIFLLILAFWVQLGEEVSGLKVVLAIFFQVLTIPVSSHLAGMLALQNNLPRWHAGPIDDRGGSAPPASGAHLSELKGKVR